MMTWFYFAASSIFLFTALNLLQRTIAVESKNPRALAIVFNSTACCLAILLFFLTGSYMRFSLPSNPLAWIFMAIACICYGSFERIRFAVSKRIDASMLVTILNLSVVIGFIGSLILYKETITIAKCIGILCIGVSLVLVSYKNHSKTSAKGIFLATIAAVALGIAWTLDKNGALYFNPDTYNIFVWIFPLTMIIFPIIKIKTIRNELNVVGWKILLLAGLNVVGYFFQLKAFTLADATRVIPIIQVSTLTTVLAGIVLLKERDHMPKKILAGILAFIGVLCLI